MLREHCCYGLILLDDAEHNFWSNWGVLFLLTQAFITYICLRSILSIKMPPFTSVPIWCCANHRLFIHFLSWLSTGIHEPNLWDSNSNFLKSELPASQNFHRQIFTAKFSLLIFLLHFLVTLFFCLRLTTQFNLLKNGSFFIVFGRNELIYTNMYLYFFTHIYFAFE